MQIGLVETFNTEQRNKLLVYIKIERFVVQGGCKWKGWLGFFCWPYNYVGPKIVFDHREKERANCLIRLAFKGIRIRCPDVLRWLLLFEGVLLRVLYY